MHHVKEQRGRPEGKQHAQPPRRELGRHGREGGQQEEGARQGEAVEGDVGRVLYDVEEGRRRREVRVCRGVGAVLGRAEAVLGEVADAQHAGEDEGGEEEQAGGDVGADLGRHGEVRAGGDEAGVEEAEDGEGEPCEGREGGDDVRGDDFEEPEAPEVVGGGGGGGGGAGAVGGGEPDVPPDGDEGEGEEEGVVGVPGDGCRFGGGFGAGGGVVACVFEQRFSLAAACVICEDVPVEKGGEGGLRGRDAEPEKPSEDVVHAQRDEDDVHEPEPATREHEPEDDGDQRQHGAADGKVAGHAGGGPAEPAAGAAEVDDAHAEKEGEARGAEVGEGADEVAEPPVPGVDGDGVALAVGRARGVAPGVEADGVVVEGHEEHQQAAEEVRGEGALGRRDDGFGWW